MVSEELQKGYTRKRAIIDSLVAGLPEDLERTLDNLAGLLDALIDDSADLTVAQLASLEVTADIIELVEEAGFSQVVSNLEARLGSVLDEIADSLDAAGIGVVGRTLDTAALEAFTTSRVQSIADEIAGGIAREIQSAWVDATFTGTPVREAIKQAASNIKATTPPRAANAVGTTFSSIDRAITANVGREQSDPEDPTVFIYIGPVDSLTRDSCSVIVNKYATQEQIAQLDNGQIPNVAATGGGYNCRHSWAPLSLSTAKAESIQPVTAADVKAFNAAGSRKVRKK